MKKLLAVLIASVLMLSVFTMFASAEAVAIDGDLSDACWLSDGWTSVNSENGYWQGIPASESISYKYQFRADDTKLYAAFELDCAVTEGGNGAGTNVRFWLNTNDAATVYTHFYDVYYSAGAVATNSKYNTSETSNSGANTADPSIQAALVSNGGKTYIEFSIDLDEFNGADGFNYYICCSNKVTENVCLYYPAVAEGETRTTNLPYSNWYRDNEGSVTIADIKISADDDDVTSDDVTSDEPVVYDEFGNFWLSHYNDGTVEGAGVVYTDTDATGDWWAHAAFAPVEGYSNVYEIVEFANKQGTAGAYSIPEGGFVYGINVGNNWPQLIEQGGCKGDGATGLWYDTPEHMTYPNYAGVNVVPMWDAALTWKVGDKFIINGLDLDNLTVPTTTPDVAWYEDSYVCTAQYKAFVEGDPDALPEGAEDDTTDNETSATSPAGDASSMIVFAVIALVAIAGSAVVIKTRK